MVKLMGVIKKMKEILLTEKEMVFLVLLYFHVRDFATFSRKVFTIFAAFKYSVIITLI